MGKRKKRVSRTAIVKTAKRFPDPYTPAYLRSSKAFYDRKAPGATIDMVSPIPVTITHGKRGLTIARANVIPRMAAKLRHEAVMAVEAWTSLRQGGLTEFHRISLIREDKYTLELFFRGQEFLFVQTNYKTMIEARSRSYPTRDRAMLALKTKRIYWTETFPLQTDSPSVAPSVPPSG